MPCQTHLQKKKETEGVKTAFSEKLCIISRSRGRRWYILKNSQKNREILLFVFTNYRQKSICFFIWFKILIILFYKTISLNRDIYWAKNWTIKNPKILCEKKNTKKLLDASNNRAFFLLSLHCHKMIYLYLWKNKQIWIDNIYM